MAIELRVLFVEDSADDLLLVLRELRRADFQIEWQRVDTAAELQRALDSHWDIILADYSMPRLSAMVALTVVRTCNAEVPFIVVSGSIGEETAVGLLQAGAQDYVMKDNLSRLAPSIRRSLRELALRRERQQAEEALRESEERWLFALEGSGDSVWDWDIQADRVYYSRRWKEMLGYTEEEIGDSFEEWTSRLHPDDTTASIQATQHYLSGIVPTYNAEYRLRCKDASYRWILARGKVVARTNEGVPLRMVGTASDITQRKQAEAERLLLEQQLQQSQKMEALGTLAGGIAHDFNNILTAIMGYTSLLEHDVASAPDSLEMVSEIGRASQRAKNLVQQILSFSRPQERQHVPIRIQMVIEEALRLLRAALPANITISTKIDLYAPPVLADASQIHQIIMNLMTNAAAAIERQKGEIEVTLNVIEYSQTSSPQLADLAHGSYVQLSICDNGRGMDAATLERIFEPFFTTKMPGQGTGLGLSVVHSVVKSHNGVISVASEPGKGSMFQLFFPAQLDQGLVSTTLRTSFTTGQGERILYVDDEITICRLVARMLERLGYSVTIRTDAAQAVATFQLRADEFQMAIIDLTMPEMSGLEVARHMLERRPAMPVLLTTGYSASMTDEQLQALGIRKLLMKPFTTEDLGRIVAEMLQS
jgi:two-component system, cell cycle sensor histidine kinase and response regulator CckA